MYIGSTDTRGLMHCLWEIIDNAVDEALAGACTRIDVILHPDGSAEVHDNGRGIPVDKEPKTGLSGVEVVFTKLHAGGKFGGGSYNATGGLHGVGSSVVNALSARLDVEVDRSPATQRMSFRRGAPGVFDGDGPTATFTEQSGLHKGKRVAKGVTGTRIRFWPDRQVFTKDADVRLRRPGHPGPADLVPRPRPRARDPRRARRRSPSRSGSSTTAASPSTASSWPPDEPVTDVLRLEGHERFTETVPLLDDKGHMTPQDVERDLGRRRRAAVGDRLRHRGAVLRQRHRDAQGRHPRRRLRARR